MAELPVVLPLVTLLVFAGVGLLVFAGLQALGERERVGRRVKALSSVGRAGPLDVAGPQEPWFAIDPARLGLDTRAQRTLRAALIRAGFFGPASVSAYAVIRVALLAGFPLIGFLMAPLAFGSGALPGRVVLALLLFAVGYYLPKAAISRLQQRLEGEYRLIFPDFLDMLVVCVNAGLSLEAALDRTARELGEGAVAFRANLDLMAGEMRAGKSTSDALKSLSERLGLPEARAFVALLQQTIELGTDVAQALTTFSDEMRDKRMSSAEEKAAALPPKLTIPLGLFIFPVVLIAVLAPAVLKVMGAFGR
ncbi:type II secretion system F family protein [Lichenihabitans sp. Uapishka_5]|uniref:type II secretion system F family protein n=1 Tax=Lichenihabitans sp. Uapishka_5 TaxID=3037302 RepID=UPI0029E7DAEC|nr:type II secretion system F family protein [Lichenihabitans sp. Uapishka_5]MDX7951724.1 type II secretion system F family protein [Lichenihabitans sp. Uapishka_5]